MCGSNPLFFAYHREDGVCEFENEFGRLNYD
jgi:hypothetical protein